MSRLRYDHVPPRREPATLKTLFAGVAFIRARPVVLGVISLDLFAVLLGGATALLPIFARDILHTGPWGLGLLRAAPAVGALVMSVWLARHALQRRVGSIMFASVAGFGVGTLVFAVSQTLWLSMLALACAGRVRHGQHGYPRCAGATGNPGCGAWPRQCGELDFHQHVEPAGRI